MQWVIDTFVVVLCHPSVDNIKAFFSYFIGNCICQSC